MLFAPVWLFVFYRFDFITQFRSNISRSSGGSEEQGKVNVRKICFIIHWAPTAPSQPASTLPVTISRPADELKQHRATEY
jgi:hypothetical protein